MPHKADHLMVAMPMVAHGRSNFVIHENFIIFAFRLAGLCGHSQMMIESNLLQYNMPFKLFVLVLLQIKFSSGVLLLKGTENLTGVDYSFSRVVASRS